MKKKVISVLLAATMIGGLLAGCGSGSGSEGSKSEDGKTTIRFLSAMELVDEEMIEAFEAENPDIDANFAE